MARFKKFPVAFFCGTLLLMGLMVSSPEVRSEGTAKSTFSAELPTDGESRKRARAHEESIQRPYAKSKTLKDAVEALRKQLAHDEMKEYALLLTAEGVQRALAKSLAAHAADHSWGIERAENKAQTAALERSARQFDKTWRPIFGGIIENGIWPEGSYFHYLKPARRYSGLSVMLQVKSPKPIEISPSLPSSGFALRILEVKFGDDSPREATNGTLKISKSR